MQIFHDSRDPDLSNRIANKLEKIRRYEAWKKSQLRKRDKLRIKLHDYERENKRLLNVVDDLKERNYKLCEISNESHEIDSNMIKNKYVDFAGWTQVNRSNIVDPSSLICDGDFACVYAVFNGEELCYIGSTRNFIKRMTSHKIFAFMNFTCILISPTRDYVNLHNIEIFLIRKYKPKYNSMLYAESVVKEISSGTLQMGIKTVK